MQPPKELDKWIRASLAKHFNSNISGVTFYLKGEPRQDKDHDYAILRIMGPNIMETVKDSSLVTVTVNILVSSKISETNLYLHAEHVGEVREAFQDIRIEDEGTLIGCLKLRQLSGKSEFVEVTEYAKDPELNVLQSTVQGHFKFYYNR